MLLLKYQQLHFRLHTEFQLKVIYVLYITDILTWLHYKNYYYSCIKAVLVYSHDHYEIYHVHFI
jgi:hypothetical protein